MEPQDRTPSPTAQAAPPQADSTSSSLQSQVARSFGWSLVGQVAQRGATWLSTILLVHLLQPEDYGTYSIAATVAMFLLAFNDLAVGYAVTRHQGDDLDDVAGTAASLALGTSIAIFGLVYAAAPAIVGLFNPPPGSSAVGVVRLVAFAIVIDGAIAAQGGLITRELREQVRVSCELVGFGCALITNFTLAFAGVGAWSLAAGQVVGSAVTASGIMLRSPNRVHFRWKPHLVGPLTRFGVPLMIAGTLNQLILNSDYVIVTRYLSLATAGAYFVAFNVSNWPVSLIHFAMRRSAIGGFARLQHNRTQLQRAFAQATALLIAVTAPMALLIALLANDVMTFLFPQRYAAGAVALRFLAGISVFRLVFTLCLDLLTVLGRSVAILWMQAVWWATLVPAMWWGATNHGLVGVGVAQFVVALAIALPLLNFSLAREGMRLSHALRDLRRPAVGCALAAGACLAARLPIHESGLRLLAGGAAGSGAYLAVVLPGSPVLDRLKILLERRLRRCADGTAAT